MLRIVQDTPGEETVLKYSIVQKAVKSGMMGILNELSEEYRTVEAVEYIISEMLNGLKDMQI